MQNPSFYWHNQEFNEAAHGLEQPCVRISLSCSQSATASAYAVAKGKQAVSSCLIHFTKGAHGVPK